MWLCSKKITSKKQLNVSFGFFLAGTMLFKASIASVFNLQTSLNVKHGLGAVTLLIYAGTGISCALFVTPILLQYINKKSGLILADVTALTFILLNLYPAFQTLIPGAVALGFTRSGFWICSGSLIVYYAKQYDLHGKKSFNEYFSMVNAMHFCSYQSAQIFGNLIPFTVFQIGLSLQSEIIANNSTIPAVTSSTMSSSATVEQRKSINDICGANDCQDSDITNQNLSNYQAPSNEIYKIAIGIVVTTSLIGFLFHALFVPIPITNGDKKQTDEYDDIKNKSDVEDKCNDDLLKTESSSSVAENMSLETKTRSKGTTSMSDQSTITNSKFTETVLELKETVMQLFCSHQLLLMILQLHTGLSVAFVSGEITRAFVSCAYGVSLVGISMSLYGASSLVCSFFTGKLSGKFGRKYAMVVGFIANTLLYVFCLLWTPNNESRVWTVMAMFILCGIVDSILLTISSETTLTHFPSNRNRAYTCWIVWTSTGMLIQFAWSTSLCVRYKIYAMFCTLIFGVVNYGIAERAHEKRTRKMQS